MAAHEKISFGQFGDRRDTYSDRRMYQPPGSKHRFELERTGGSVMARKLGKSDEILPGGRPAKSLAGGLHTWQGGTGSPEGHREVLNLEVRRGYRGLGLADAMLTMAVEKHPNLSHSSQLSPEGARFASRNPLPGDTEATKAAQRRHATADAATAMLGGPKRRGFV